MLDKPVHADDARVRADVVSVGVERAISYLRLVIMASGSVLLPLLADRPGTIAWLAYLMLGLGWVYALAVVIFEPYRRFPILLSAWFTAPSDITMTLLWIGATGGANSPWVVALFVAVVSASLRYRPRDTLVVAVLAVAGYVAVVAIGGQLVERAWHTTIVSLYLILVAALCAVIARERLGRFASRLELLDLTQEVAQVGSWEWTISDGALSWSRELRRIFGFAEDARLTVDMYFGAVHADDREMVRQCVDTALAERAPLRFEHRITTSAGTIRWLQCRGRVVLDETGMPRQIVGSSQDITDAKEMQERLLVGRKLASLGTLASGIAHEINNPLAYVATSLELARRRVESGSLDDMSRRSLDAALDAAQDGCRRVAEIVRGLRIFSRADDDGTTAVDLAVVVDSALAIASHEIGQRAQLVRDYQSAPPVVGTESRLLQVVLNLVVNAAHAIDAGSRPDHEIRVKVEPTSDGRVLLAVSDTGSGIASEHVPKIFDPFFTTKDPGVGMGLGLSICHGIVRDFGGEIRVETEIGRGTTFTVLFPVATSAPRPVNGKHRRETGAPRLRVLLIDDEKTYAISLGTLLGISHEVTIAHDGGRALSMLCAGEAFDVILCDLMMSGITGMDLHEAIADIQPTVVPRIVFLTGGATTDRARSFLQRPDVRHLEKPVEIATLEKVIREVTRPARADAS